MTDIFELPKKEGFGVGVKVVVADDTGAQLSSSEHEMYGFDNPTADGKAKEIIEAVEKAIEAWSKEKYGGRPKRG